MNRKLTLFLLGAVFADFLAYTGYLTMEHGMIALFTDVLATAGGRQIAVDLMIALTLAAVWIWRDAKARGRNPIGWVLLTFGTGSFGPLLYLFKRTWDAEESPRVTRPAGAAA